MKYIKIEVCEPGTPVQLKETPEIKTTIRDARVDIFIDTDDENKVKHVIEYGLEHSMNKLYPESSFTEIPAGKNKTKPADIDKQ